MGQASKFSRVFAFALLPVVLSTAAPTLPRLVLTNVANGLDPVEQFSCSERIHGYITLPEKAVGSHVIEGIWVTPQGRAVEHSRNQVEFPAPGRQTAYVWLAFDDKTGGMMEGFRPGQESEASREAYSGDWKVRVLWDGKPLVESNFKVKCS